MITQERIPRCASLPTALRPLAILFDGGLSICSNSSPVTQYVQRVSFWVRQRGDQQPTTQNMHTVAAVVYKITTLVRSCRSCCTTRNHLTTTNPRWSPLPPVPLSATTSNHSWSLRDDSPLSRGTHFGSWRTMVGTSFVTDYDQ